MITELFRNRGNFLFISILFAYSLCGFQTPPEFPGIPLVWEGDTLLTIKAEIGPFSPLVRIEEIHKKLDYFVEQRLNPDSIVTQNTGSFTNIQIDNIILMSVSDDDAAFERVSRAELAEKYKHIYQKKLSAYLSEFSLEKFTKRAIYALIVIIISLVLFISFKKGILFLGTKLKKYAVSPKTLLHIKDLELLNTGHLVRFTTDLIKALYSIANITLVYFCVIYTLHLVPWLNTNSFDSVAVTILKLLLSLIAVISILNILKHLFRRILIILESWQLLSAEKTANTVLSLLTRKKLFTFWQTTVKISKFASILLVLYLFIVYVFSLTVYTAGWADQLLSYLFLPVKTSIASIIAYLPNLFAIIVILFIIYGFIKLLRLLADAVESNEIQLANFPTEWVRPTFELVRFLIIGFAAIIIFPYLPGSGSPMFQGITVFLGVLISLGSSSSIANIMAGVVLTYMRPFKTGDRVNIAGTMGDIAGKNLLVIRLRTIKNVDVIIPNAIALSGQILNYTTLAKESALILHTTVTIGYDTPWKQIHELLIAAAIATGDILREPAPFVLQTSLNDFYVSYEINAYTKTPEKMAGIYSALHANIQDKFNEAGVEIMSPHYSSIRDGNRISIPDDYLPKSYVAQSFKITNDK